MKALVGFDLDNYPHARALEAVGACDFVRYDRAFLEKRVAEYDVIVPHLGVSLGADLLARAARLRMIATPTTGRDHFDLKYCLAKGVEVVSLNEDMEFLGRITSTAEHAFLLILAAARNLRRAADRVAAQRSWDNADLRGFELKGKTLGIVGYGRLGHMVEGYARAFGMTVLVHDLAAVEPVFGESCPLARLLAESDVVSLHAKWLPGEPPVIDAKAVSLMKSGAILVNTARGGLVDGRAVVDGLRSGRLGSVAIDVANGEYQDYRLPEDPLVEEALKNPRILLTPHVGGATLDAHRVVFAELAQLIKNRLAAPQEKP